MGRNWGSPGPASTDFTLSDYMGQLVIVAVGGFERDISTSFGDRDAVRAAVVVLTGEHAGEQFPDCLLFNTRIVSRFRSQAGSIVLGAVVLADGKGANQPVDLVEVGADAYAVADAWEQQNPGVLDKLLAEVVESHRAEMSRGQRPAQAQTQPAQRPRQAPTGSWSAGGAQTSAPAPGWTAQAAAQQSATLESMRSTAIQTDEPPF